jgi:hypothetical protein
MNNRYTITVTTQCSERYVVPVTNTLLELVRAINLPATPPST